MPDAPPPATSPPDLSADRHRDLVGRRHEPWVRRGVLVVFVAVIALGLANVFGQRATTSSAAGAAAGRADGGGAVAPPGRPPRAGRHPR